MSGEKLEPHYKPSEVAFILGVTTETLRRYEKLGLLKARRLPSGHIRIPKSEVERLLSYPPKWHVKAGSKNNKIHRNVTKNDTKYTIDTLDTKQERVKGSIIP